MDLDIRIDRTRCMGSANCQYWADGVFDLDDEGLAHVIDPNAAPEDRILLAAEGCPTGAISVWRDGAPVE